MREKPPYALASVDHALHLVTVLHQEGPLRVTDAAERLGVSVSTAHRLLATLVHRDFAEQGPDKRYYARFLRTSEEAEVPVALLRRVALPHLQRLVARVNETAHLAVRSKDLITFIATVECDQALRVGDRAGRALPAHLASAGKGMLAALPPDVVTALYQDDADVDLNRLRRELRLVRKRGFAINHQLTETGLTAVGMVLRDHEDAPTAAISVAMPSARFHADVVPVMVRAMSAAIATIQTQLQASSTSRSQ